MILTNHIHSEPIFLAGIILHRVLFSSNTFSWDYRSLQKMLIRSNMLGTGFMAIIWIVFIADRLVTGLIRRCNCEDDHECREKALNLVDKCSSDCGNNLAPLGGNIQDLVDCFGKQGPSVQAEDICLRRKIGYKCENQSQSTFINEINSDNLEFMIDKSTKPTFGSFMQEIYDSLNAIVKYNYCIRSCYKNITTSCFKRKSCGHELVDRETLTSFVKDCIGAHPMFYIEQMQACNCLLHKLHIMQVFGKLSS
ncbi:hypothetical protein X798_08044 [Onchocerca flexuosa]|uniref:Uncharacterized protein n=1 Tax=Onchocerca flexuosa TaxID=387005 RepID=A0A238BKE6_9BILA|nr:hypothetical protein X798_08044 [Onchocerca flexuosa]